MVKNRIVQLGLAGLVALLAVFMFLKQDNVNSDSDLSSRNEATNQISAGESLPTDTLSYGKRRHLSRAERIRMIKQQATNAEVRTMSPEEMAALEEMISVTENLTDKLDGHDDAGALAEARLLTSHTNREVRLMALMSMQWIGAQAAADVVPFFGDPDLEVRAMAEDVFFSAIEEMDHPDMQLAMLKTALGSSSPALKIRAMDEMIFLPEHLTFHTYASMLNDATKEVRAKAGEYLQFISSETFDSEKDALAWFSRNKEDLELLYQE